MIHAKATNDKNLNERLFDGNMIHAKATNDKYLKERPMFSGAVTYSMIQDDHLPFYNLGIRFRLGSRNI